MDMKRELRCKIYSYEGYSIGEKHKAKESRSSNLTATGWHCGRPNELGLCIRNCEMVKSKCHLEIG